MRDADHHMAIPTHLIAVILRYVTILAQHKVNRHEKMMRVSIPAYSGFTEDETIEQMGQICDGYCWQKTMT